MELFGTALLVIGGFILLIGLISGLVKSHFWVTEPLLAFLLGVILGPFALGVFDPATWPDHYVLFELAAGVTLAIALMEVALRLPKDIIQKIWRQLVLLILVVLPLMWLISAALIHTLLAVPVLVALAAGALVMPTDPVVATAVLTGRTAESRLPERLRILITAESGANDGLALPFIMIPLLLLTVPGGFPFADWFGNILIWQVGGGAALGILVGFAAGKALHLAERKETIEKTSYLAFTLSLSLFVFGLAFVAGMEPLLAVFAAGLALDHVMSAEERHQEEKIQETVNLFFTLPVYTLLGVAMPWQQIGTLGWGVLALAVLVLVFRRMPVILLTRRWLRDLRGLRSALFMGWFGPIGVASLFYAVNAVKLTGEDVIWHIVTLLVATSVIAHGITATPFTKLYGPEKFPGGDRDDEEVGNVP